MRIRSIQNQQSDSNTSLMMAIGGTGSINSNKNINNPTSTFVVVVVVCLIVLIIAVLFFSLLRTKLKSIYAPRLILLRNDALPLGKLPSSLFAWISPAFMINDEEIFNHLGIDALVYIRFLKLVIKVVIFILPYGIIVLIPLNLHGGMHLSEGLDQISMSNMKEGSRKLWAHFLAIWIYSIALLYFINEEWKVYILYRQAYLAKGLGKQFTLLVRDIPAENLDTEKFRSYVQKLFPDQVFKIHIVQELSKWNLLIKKHDTLVRNLERAKVKYEDQRKAVNVTTILTEPKENQVVNLEQRLQMLQEKLANEQTASHMDLPCALVFFKSLSSRSSASQIVWDVVVGNYIVEESPDAAEIEWRNLKFSANKRKSRKILSNIIVVCLTILWAIPISFVSFLTKIQSVAEKLKFLNSFVSKFTSVGQGFVQGLIPVMLTSLLYMVMPSILRMVGRFRGLISKPQIEAFIFQCFTFFLVANTFFVYISTGSFFSKTEEIIKSPQNITRLLAISLPSQANFYLNYISLLAFAGTGLELTRLLDMIYIFAYLRMYAKTARERLEVWKPGSPPYAKLFAYDILIFLIGISYSVLHPIILPVVFVYFGFAYVLWVYQLLHVYIPAYDLQGKLWPNAASSMVVGALVFQLLMIGVFSLKKAIYIIACLVPLPIITIIFWRYMISRYDRIGRYLSLREGCTTRGADHNFLQKLADSYVLNASCPEMYQLSSKPQVDDFDRNEYDCITDEND